MSIAYTPEEDVIIRELIAAGADDSEFRRKVGRARKLCRSHIQWIDSAEFRQACYDRRAITRREKPSVVSTVAARPAPKPEQIEAALHRNYAPRSITATLLGDPAPGQSALDRLNTAEARV